MKPLVRTSPLHPEIPQAARGVDLDLIIRSSFLLITFAVLALSPLCHAQDEETGFTSAIEVARSDMRAQRASIITRAMNFSDKEADAFWPIYRQYEYERSKLDDGRVAVIKEYTDKYSTLGDADAKAMAERMFECDSRLAELKKNYFKKFNKVLPALTVAKFFQLERRIDLLTDMQVEAALPPLTELQVGQAQ